MARHRGLDVDYPTENFSKFPELQAENSFKPNYAPADVMGDFSKGLSLAQQIEKIQNPQDKTQSQFLLELMRERARQRAEAEKEGFLKGMVDYRQELDPTQYQQQGYEEKVRHNKAMEALGGGKPTDTWNAKKISLVTSLTEQMKNPKLTPEEKQDIMNARATIQNAKKPGDIKIIQGTLEQKPWYKFWAKDKPIQDLWTSATSNEQGGVTPLNISPKKNDPLKIF